MPLFDTKLHEPKFCETDAEKSDKEEVRWSTKMDTMKHAIGKIENGKTIHFVTAAYWSMYELLEYVMQQTGPARIDAFTWNLSMSAVRTFIRLQDSGKITNLRILVNSVMQRFVAEAIGVMQSRCEKLVLYPNHAKGFLLDDGKMKISVISSANFSTNPQIECGVISTTPKTYDMHRRWLDPLFENRELLSSRIVENRTEPKSERGKVLLIIRGLPGSGKTLAGMAASEECFSNDDYFEAIPGEYTFSPTRMPAAKAQCWNNVKAAMERGENTISVCNVFAEDADVMQYMDLARINGYTPQVLCAENWTGTKNIHGIQDEKIDRMRTKLKVRL